MKTRTRTNAKVNPSPQPKVTTTLERHSISQELAPSQAKSFSSANSNSNPYSHNLSHISPFRPASKQIIIAGERDSKTVFEQLETKNFSKAVVQPRTNSFISSINSISSTDSLKVQRGLFKRIKKGVKKVGKAISKGFDWVKEKIVNPIKRAAKRLLNSIKNQAKRLVSSLKNSAKRLLGKAKRAILNFIRKIKRVVRKLILKAKRLVTKVIRKAQRYAMKIAKKVASVAKKLLRYARNLAKKYAQKMMKLTQYFLKIGNPQKAQKLIQKLNQFAGKIVDWATKKIMGLVRRATAIVTKVMQQATRQISRLINWAAGGVQRLVKKVTSVTQRLINGAIKGVENFIRKAGNVTHLFNKAKSKLNGILGPARGKANWLIDSMMKAANNMLRGFLMPLAKRAGGWMRRLLRPAMKLVSKLLNKATSGIDRVIKAATNKLTQSMQWLIGKIKKLLELYVEKVLKTKLQIGATIVKRVIDGVIKAIEKIILEPLKAFFEFMNLISQILAKAAGVIDKILAHPVRFIKNLFSGVKQGLSGFISRLGIHMQKGLQTFLFGSMGETGIEMPKSFDFSGLISVVAQISGISYDRIRGRAAGKLGEEKVAFLEEGAAAAQEGNLGEFAEQKAQGYADNQMAAVKEKAGPLGKIADIFKILREGPSGIIQYFKELDFNSLITGIIGEIKEYLIQEIVQKAVIQVISYLTPGAGWLKAAIDALRMMYALFIERAQQIKEFLDGFTDSIVNIAKRAIAPAVKKLEGALGKTLPLLIGVLADYLGIGGIPQKIQGFLMKGRKWVDANVMPIIDKILDKIAAIFAKLPSANIADYLPKGMGMGAVYPKIRKYLKPYTKKTFKTFNDAQKVVNTAQTVFKRFGIKSLNLEQADKTGHTFNVIAAKPLPGRKISPVVGRVQTFNNIQPRASLGKTRAKLSIASLQSSPHINKLSLRRSSLSTTNTLVSASQYNKQSLQRNRVKNEIKPLIINSATKLNKSRIQRQPGNKFAQFTIKQANKNKIIHLENDTGNSYSVECFWLHKDSSGKRIDIKPGQKLKFFDPQDSHPEPKLAIYPAYQKDEMVGGAFVIRAGNSIHLTPGKHRLSSYISNQARRKSKLSRREISDAEITIIDIATDLIPGISNIKDAIQAITGRNPITGEKLSILERIWSGLCAIPGYGNALKYIGKGVKLFAKALKWFAKKYGKQLITFVKSVVEKAKKQIDKIKRRSRKSGKKNIKGKHKVPVELIAFVESQDKINTPVEKLLVLLNTRYISKYPWIKKFGATPKAVPGHYIIYFIASPKTPIDRDYTDRKDRIAHGGWYTRKKIRRMIHEAKYSPHGNKHLKARTQQEAKQFSYRAAQYLPDVNNAKLERAALLNGKLIPKKNESFWKIHKFDRYVGFDQGQKTRWIRVEYSSGTYHGHPMTIERVRKYIKNAQE